MHNNKRTIPSASGPQNNSNPFKKYEISADQGTKCLLTSIPGCSAAAENSIGNS
ncbi:MAG: hypothetical protein IPP86_04250 [Bacteroidetes bacterium]|nr:hypothetical protein [Bacteroidota bacterium]